jgi:hypothetical protein
MNRLLRVCGATILAGSLGVLSAYGQHSGKGGSKDKDGNNEETTVNNSGQQVAVDANSGKLRQPTAQEVQQLTESLTLNDSVEGLTPTTTPDGGMMVDLQGRFQSVAIAKKNPDGSLAQACVESSKQAADFLKSKPAEKKDASASKQAAPAAPVSKKSSTPAELEVK